MFSLLTRHALARLAERFEPAEASALGTLAEQVARKHPDDVAVLLAALPQSRGPKWHPGLDDARSNGDLVWAVIRHGVVVSVMYRRHTQPLTREFFAVRTLIDAHTFGNSALGIN